MKTQQMHGILRRRTLLGAFAVGAVSQTASAQAPAQQDPWPSLAAQIFNGRAIQDGSGIVAIDAPYRAEDAALVPIEMHNLLPPDDTRRIVRHHTRDRRKPLAPGGRVLSRCIQRDAIAVHAGARRLIHQPSCRGGTERRPPLRHATVRQGGRRLLGSCLKARGGLDPARHHALSSVPPAPRCRSRQERGAAPDPSPQLFGHADGSTDPPLRSCAFREVRAHLAGPGSAALHRERHFHFREPKLPLRLPPERRGHLQSRDGGQRGQVIPAGVARDRRPDGWPIQKQRTSASACASSRSRTIVLVDALRNSCAEISARGAAHAQYRLGLLVLVVRQHRGDHINRA